MKTGLERVLIVGLGSIGRRHLRIARQANPHVKIAVLRRKESNSRNDFEVDHTFTDLGEALAFKPQAAVIATPASVHLEMAMPLAQAGIHLLVEKPLSSTAEGVLELIDICRQKKVVLLVGYNLRFLPSLRTFRELLQQGRVGTILSVRAETGQYLPDWRPGTDYRKTASASAALGGGVLLEISHEIDYLRWLFGDIVWVSATLGRYSRLEIDVEDTAHLTLGFASDVTAGPLVADLNLDFIRHDTTRTCTAIGENGTLRWDAITGRVLIFGRGAAAWNEISCAPQDRDASYISEWEHFLGCIDTGDEPEVGGHAALQVLRLVEAARLSSLGGRRISLS